MITDARTVVLERIRRAIATAPPPQSSVAPQPRSSDPAGLDAVAQFAARVAEYRASVWMAAPGHLPSVIAAVAAERGARSVVVPIGTPEPWLDALPDAVLRLREAGGLDYETLDGADAVLTGCASAIAESGTVVLDAGPAQGRRALTLLPDHHICVVAESQIVLSIADALPVLDPKRPLTWISGPSATSDIELQRVEGVHGPRVLDIIVLRVDRVSGSLADAIP